MSARNERSQASSLWMILSVVSFVFSLALALLPVLRVISNTSPLTSILGWLLTPVATFVFFGVDQNAQNRNGNRNFVRKPGYSRTLQIIAIASIGLLFPHVLRLAGLWSVVNS